MGLLDGLPEDKLPQCWSDDVRMNALFAPFRLKSVNPESWEMKMKFWSDMLRQWCKCRKDPVITAADAKFAFQRKGRTPACLDIVVEEMFRNGDLCLPSKYQQILHNGPEGWVKWGARLAFKPAALALTAVTSLLPGRQAIDNDGMPKASIESTQRFVVESVIKEQATDLLNNYPRGVDRVGTIDELLRNSETGYDRELFELLLGWLVSQGCAVKKGDVIKIAELDKKATPITEADEALAKLMRAETRLESDEARLAKEVVAAENDARAAVQVGNRLAAKNHLRRKHRAAQRLGKCTAALENVRHLQSQMRDVEENAVIVDTFKSSTMAMKQSMQDGGFEEDAVHDTMDDLKEVLSAVQFLANGGYQRQIGQDHALCAAQTTIGKFLDQFVNSLNQRLLPQWIQFPGTESARRGVSVGFQEKFGVPNVLGAIDCTHIKIFPPSGPQGAQYKNLRKGDHTINVQLVMDSYNEVEKALSSNVDDFDAAELEQELKDLLASPGSGGGGTPGKEEREKTGGTKLTSQSSENSRRKVFERDFIFDGEERMLAELNELDLEDGSPRESRVLERKKKVALPAGEWIEEEKPSEKTKPDRPSKPWYPPSGESLKPEAMWGNNNLEPNVRETEEFGELRQDDRLHPGTMKVVGKGQPLNVDFSTPPKLYTNDFQVKDHKMADGVWLYNRDLTPRDGNRNLDSNLAHSTEYFCSESPGKTGGNFQMAPGGERKKEKTKEEELSVTEESSVTEETSVTEDLERRLKNLRGFDL